MVLGPSWSWIIPLFVSVSAFGTLHASVFASGRQVYSASREGHLPAVISYVNKFSLTPLPGLLFTAALGVVFILLKDINQLLNMYMVAASFFYGLCMLALVVMRRTRREAAREFKVWLVIPLVIMLFFWYCTIAPLTEWEDHTQCPLSPTNTTGAPCESHYSLPPDNVDMVRPAPVTTRFFSILHNCALFSTSGMESVCCPASSSTSPDISGDSTGTPSQGSRTNPFLAQVLHILLLD